MENNTGYPNKVTGGRLPGQQFSTLNTGHLNETHFIGLGSGGANAVKYIWSQWEKGRFTVVNDPDDAAIPEGISLIPFCSPKGCLYSGRMGEFWLPDMEKPLLMPEELNQVLSGDGRFILLAGLGGYTGTKVAEALSLLLQKEQKDFLTICSMPFSFEGTNSHTIAREAKERMKTIPNCHFFELDVVRKEKEDLSLSEAFQAGEGYFYKIISKLKIV